MCKFAAKSYGDLVLHLKPSCLSTLQVMCIQAVSMSGNKRHEHGPRVDLSFKNAVVMEITFKFLVRASRRQTFFNHSRWRFLILSRQMALHRPYAGEIVGPGGSHQSGCDASHVNPDILVLQALFNKGNLHRQCSEHADAVSCYEHVLMLDNNHWRSMLNKAVAELGLGRRDAARQSLKEAYRLSGDLSALCLMSTRKAAFLNPSHCCKLHSTVC